jgi:hypothetical protein
MAAPDTDGELAVVTILSLGAKGGGVTLFGCNRGEGDWKFFASGIDQTPTFLTGEDEGDEIVSRTGWVSGWDAALGKLDERYRYWPRLSPLAVHSEFRDRILDAVRVRCGEGAVEKWVDRIDMKARIAKRRREMS